MPADKAARLAEAMARPFGEGFLEDVEIWKHKARIDNPLLTEEDGAVYQHRRWYEQFYVEIADVAADMTDRFEMEVDTGWLSHVRDAAGRRRAFSGPSTTATCSSRNAG